MNYFFEEWKEIGQLGRFFFQACYLQDLLSLRKKAPIDLKCLLSFLEGNSAGMTNDVKGGKEWKGLGQLSSFAGLLHLVLTGRRCFLLMLMPGHLTKR